MASLAEETRFTRPPWPGRLASTLVRALALGVAASTIVLIPSHGIALGLGLFVVGLTASVLTGVVLWVPLHAIDVVIRHCRFGPLALSHNSQNDHRPIPFFHDEDPKGAPQDELNVAVLAARAVGSKDLLTRRLLSGGDDVLLCIANEGSCGAAFPFELGAEVAAATHGQCPACGASSSFVRATLPGTPPPLPLVLTEAASAETTRRLVFRAAS